MSEASGREDKPVPRLPHTAAGTPGTHVDTPDGPIPAKVPDRVAQEARDASKKIPWPPKASAEARRALADVDGDTTNDVTTDDDLMDGDEALLMDGDEELLDAELAPEVTDSDLTTADARVAPARVMADAEEESEELEDEPEEAGPAATDELTTPVRRPQTALIAVLIMSVVLLVAGVLAVTGVVADIPRSLSILMVSLGAAGLLLALLPRAAGAVIGASQV